jgi:hypothetical protein
MEYHHGKSNLPCWKTLGLELGLGLNQSDACMLLHVGRTNGFAIHTPCLSLFVSSVFCFDIRCSSMSSLYRHHATRLELSCQTCHGICSAKTSIRAPAWTPLSRPERLKYVAVLRQPSQLLYHLHRIFRMNKPYLSSSESLASSWRSLP